VPDQTTSEQQTSEIAGCFFELIGNIVGQAEQVAQRFGIPAPFIKALHTLECPMAMKELGKRMHCDPSFVTLVADMLEKRGLAFREPHPADRRVKNIVLTDEGLELKRAVEAEITARMPWNKALSADERTQLLALISKMVSYDPIGAAAAGAAAKDAMQGHLASLFASALQEGDAAESPTSPPASTGEVNSAVSGTSAAS
jgi:MarR family transcriptional regulator, organic hydroperoxide resistance regulator